VTNAQWVWLCALAEKLRQKTGLGCDGSQLVGEALGLGKAGCPRIAFNSLTTESELEPTTKGRW
jgi:hypothetical protein